MSLRGLAPSLLFLVVAVSLFQYRNSQAVPAFARREGAQCQMCHYRLPELNEDGHAYIRRGLREERGAMAAHGSMDMGEGAGAKQPVAATVRPLGEPLPLAWQDYMTLMGHHTYEARDGEKAGFHPGEIAAWIAGPLDAHWSGVAELEFDIEAGGVAVEQAYAQYNTSWSPRFASVRFGQVMPLAILFNGGGAEMPLTRPVVLRTASRAENPWTATKRLRGVELGYVNLGSWNAYVGVGEPQLDDLAGGNHTDVYASAEYVIGDKGHAVSGYGYMGKIAASPGQPSVDYERLALFANVYAPRTKAVLGVLWGSDKPDGQSSLDTAGGFLLAEVLLAERWAGYARYDYASRDVPVGDAEITDGPTLGVSCWVQTQVRLTLESRFLQSTGQSRDDGVIAELMWAF